MKENDMVPTLNLLLISERNALDYNAARPKGLFAVAALVKVMQQLCNEL